MSTYDRHILYRLSVSSICIVYLYRLSVSSICIVYLYRLSVSSILSVSISCLLMVESIFLLRRFMFFKENRYATYLTSAAVTRPSVAKDGSTYLGAYRLL
jgi:hypothetical protein